MNDTSSSFDIAEARRQVGDDEEILREVMQLFVDDVPKRVAELRAAVERRDAALLERSAHTLKGSCVVFGAGPARDAANRVESMGKRRELDGAADAVASLVQESERLAADLKAFLGSSPK
jgi:two-component system sensor histidine kinase/response regulator